MQADLAENILPALRPARVHEVEGHGSISFAAYQMGLQSKAIAWISLQHHGARLLVPELPVTVQRRLTFIDVSGEDDLLWAMEEALRSAPLGLVIAQPEKPLSLTVGRRLQLAAEAGQTTGLMLIRAGQGSNAAETRWQCAPMAGQAGSTLHQWKCIKNKMGTFGDWVVNWDGKAVACHMVKEAAL